MDGRKDRLVLWLADEKGWAYDQIFHNVTAQLPGYRHEVFYMMGEHTWSQWAELGYRMAEADVIVSMHLMYQHQMLKNKSKVVMMLTGHRIFE